MSDEDYKKRLQTEIKKLDFKAKLKEKRDNVWNMWIHCVKPGDRRKVLGGESPSQVDIKKEKGKEEK